MQNGGAAAGLLALVVTSKHIFLHMLLRAYCEGTSIASAPVKAVLTQPQHSCACDAEDHFMYHLTGKDHGVMKPLSTETKAPAIVRM